MKVTRAFSGAGRLFFRRLPAVIAFATIELCILLITLSPLLFLWSKTLQLLSLLSLVLFVFLFLPMRQNAAAAMQEALSGGSLCSCLLISFHDYGGKLVHALKRLFFVLLWSLPLIAGLIIARRNISGEIDGITLMKNIKAIGGGELLTGMLYLCLILLGCLLLIALGCAFHCGARHAYALGDKQLVRGHHGALMLTWLFGLVAVLPMIAALAVAILRYLPLLSELSSLLMGYISLPDTKVTLLILAIGLLLTFPLLPLRSLIPAAYMNGLKKES